MDLALSAMNIPSYRSILISWQACLSYPFLIPDSACSCRSGYCPLCSPPLRLHSTAERMTPMSRDGCADFEGLSAVAANWRFPWALTIRQMDPVTVVVL